MRRSNSVHRNLHVCINVRCNRAGRSYHRAAQTLSRHDAVCGYADNVIRRFGMVYGPYHGSFSSARLHRDLQFVTFASGERQLVRFYNNLFRIRLRQRKLVHDASTNRFGYEMKLVSLHFHGGIHLSLFFVDHLMPARSVWE